MGPVDLAPQEGFKMVDESINFSVEVKITKLENGEASITIPAELRLTQNLLSYISGALGERELTLKHMDITEQHRQELADLPNVVLQDKEDE